MDRTAELQILKGCFIEDESNMEWRITKIWYEEIRVKERRHIQVVAKAVLWGNRHLSLRQSATIVLRPDMKFAKLLSKKTWESEYVTVEIPEPDWY